MIPPLLFRLHPALLCIAFLLLSVPSARAFRGGDGSPAAPFRIATCEELQNMRLNLDAHYILIANIDCSMTNPASPLFDVDGPWGDGKGFEPVGDATGSFWVNAMAGPVFTGTLNGNNRSISHLYIDRPDRNFVGLFGVLQHGTVSLFRLNNEPE
jgi:hypothetical protein